MKPEDLVRKLQETLGSRLKSVILYGSAAAGDYLAEGSDFNILVALERLGLEELDALVPITEKWVKEGNPPPLLFTKDRFERSADVFPIEILDIKESHRVLSGEDIVAELDVSRENLRLQLEHELKGKLIQLRAAFLVTKRDSGRIVALMVDSLSSFLVLARAALRLIQDQVPAKKMEALKLLAESFQFETGAFETVQQIKEGVLKARDVEAEPLFSRYLETVERLTDRVDSFLQEQAVKQPD
ncbi:MAG: nucleotidyltransferase domain-containing protein [Acidobacteriota bacterium]